MTTKDEIITATISLLAREGYAGTSMRKVAAAINREPSIIYAHFTDKEELLRATRLHINHVLDTSQNYSAAADAHTLLYETILFQLKNREYIVALLQYFMAMAKDFPGTASGYVPDRAYAHMQRVIERGIAEGCYTCADIAFNAKASTHLVNGFLMEYFGRPLRTKELQSLATQLTNYIELTLLQKQGAL